MSAYKKKNKLGEAGGGVGSHCARGCTDINVVTVPKTLQSKNISDMKGEESGMQSDKQVLFNNKVSTS